MTTKAIFQPKMNWELDSLSNHSKCAHALSEIEKNLKQLQVDKEPIEKVILMVEEIEKELQEMESFVECLIAQDVSDQKAIQLQEQIIALRATLKSHFNTIDDMLQKLSDTEFSTLIKQKTMEPISFPIQERRAWSKEKQSLEKEDLINKLSMNGYQGWSKVYETLLGQIKIPFRNELLSIGQAENKLSNPDRQVRKELFSQWEKTWQEQEYIFAQVLNNIGGFRLNVYKERGWNNILKEPLFYNRMKEETLNAMWEAITKQKKMLIPYFEKKAKLLNIDKLSWYDLEAPLPSKKTTFIPFNEAAELIIEQLSSFSPEMGKFAKKAFQNGWIEAEDRPGKMPGGFCSQHPKSKQSRIFMTYSGTTSNLFTLTHELGHAYHNEVVKDLSPMVQQYRMNVAETASTLAETILMDSILKKTKDLQEKQVLLDNKLQRAVVFLMNIHSRFIFEKAFYEKREKGFVTASELNELMTESQKEGFLGLLKEWHPHFWASKRHFYLTDVPFYNFPYTFGYLFSLGIYATGQNCDPLLRDTGRMNVEDLAQKHLGVDLTKPDFWEAALQLIHKDINEFFYHKEHRE